MKMQAKACAYQTIYSVVLFVIVFVSFLVEKLLYLLQI